MRVAVVDIGTNSTRLLIAEVEAGAVEVLVRQSRVTRLGERVDSGHGLAEEAIKRTCAVLTDYRQLIDQYDCQANLAVLTSAVRDAPNGAEFTEHVRRDYGLDARTLSGEEEAQLTFLGAMSDRNGRSVTPTVVIDIGGGSTEFVVGHGHLAGFHTSLQAGVVRMSERHIRTDPPTPEELQQLALDTRTIFLDGLPPEERAPVLAGSPSPAPPPRPPPSTWSSSPMTPIVCTATSCCSATVEMLLARLADMTEDQRRSVVGLHPDRAPTIVAGMILLGEAMRAFELDEVEVSEHDILRGGVLRLAGSRLERRLF